MDTITISNTTTSNLYCPYCDRPLDEHERPCSGVTRRNFFLGLFAGATAAMAIPTVWGRAEALPLGRVDHKYSGGLIYRANGKPFPIIDTPITYFVLSAAIPPVKDLVYKAWRNCALPDEMLVVPNPPRPFWMRREQTT